MTFSPVLTVFLLFALLVSSLCRGQTLANSENFTKVPGGSIWYSVKGSGTKIPLLLIHGGPGGNSCALGALAQLGAQRPVVFYDQLGAGKSEQPTSPALWQIQRFVDELDSLRKNLKLTKVHLLAHSWGAAIAAQYLLDKGTDGIASVIFVGPYLSTSDWTTSTNKLREQLSASAQQVLRKHEIAGTTSSAEYQRASEEFYQLFLYRHPHRDPEECRASAWSQTIYETMWGHSEFVVTGNLKTFDAAKHLNRIKIPTLFMVGEYDMVQEPLMRAYQNSMQNAQVTLIKDAAHMSMIDQPEVFIREVNRFLEGVEKQTSTPQ